MSQTLTAEDLANSVSHLAQLIRERNEKAEFVLVGVRSRGDEVAERIQAELAKAGVHVEMGVIDISLYRDDLAHLSSNPKLQGTELPFSIDGAHVILVDDLVDTAGTLCKAAQALMDKGANSVRALCTHPVLSSNAYENIEKSVLTELIVCDTIPLRQKSSKIKVLSTAKLFARAIRNTHENRSISALFVGG